MSETRTSRTVRAIVGTGGRIEVTAPDLPEGGAVEVTVRLTDNQPERSCSALDVLNGCKGGVLFKSADEVSQHIRDERDSWGH